ncbi:LapA family protein [Yoonia sp. BS5-3]|uniref:LapA family protein n=1 Tax=Yoonia phaeophyticola TaxID=3137369 RepID=A0ABZ3IE07_9RHOB
MKTIRYAFWGIILVLLVLVGLANSSYVTLRAMPVALGDLFGISPDIDLPLYVVLFIGVGAGLLIGFLWEWLRESRMRAERRVKAREVERLKREVDQLKGAAAGAKDDDDVLALLEKTG